MAEIPMTFAEIEAVIGRALPRSAYQHRPWWANEACGHVHAQAWLEAGYETAQVDMKAGSLVFRRKAAPSVPPPARGTRSGLADETRGHLLPGPSQGRISPHPAWGALKGTFTIAPGTDLAAPMYSDAEWAEIEKEMEADWDQIADGMRSHKP